MILLYLLLQCILLSNFIEVFSDEIISSKSIAQSIIDSMNTIGYQSAEDNFYAKIIPYGNDKNIVVHHRFFDLLGRCNFTW